jgi:hypothetical protein
VKSLASLLGLTGSARSRRSRQLFFDEALGRRDGRRVSAGNRVLVLVFYGPAALLSGAQKPSAWLAFFGFATGLIVWLFGVLVERRRTE